MTSLQETPYRIEPCLLDHPPLAIADLIADLVSASVNLGKQLPAKSIASLADLVVVMNCYYSNLIENHATLPLDIERALAENFDTDPKRRNLQIEAVAHIKVQKIIDRLFREGSLPEPASIEFICFLHRTFCEHLPDELLTIEGANYRMEPGRFRHLDRHNVKVGRHLPPASEFVDEFMRYFENRYRFDNMGTSGKIIAMAAAHHRFNYIHPFPDGNGRVSRLMSYAMGLKIGIGANGLWSIARGLARGLPDAPDGRKQYKTMMDYADTPRQGDLDGRGNLSQKALIKYIEWFLQVCLDQVTFMGNLFDLENLLGRLKEYTQRHQLKPEAFQLLERILRYGELPRGEASSATGLKERAARMLLSDLIELGIVGSDTPKTPVSLRFPAAEIDTLFPRLL